MPTNVETDHPRAPASAGVFTRPLFSWCCWLKPTVQQRPARTHFLGTCPAQARQGQIVLAPRESAAYNDMVGVAFDAATQALVPALVVAFGMVLVTYSGSLWFNGLHAYSGL